VLSDVNERVIAESLIDIGLVPICRLPVGSHPRTKSKGPRDINLPVLFHLFFSH
jgi:hypothetical protein